MAKALQVVSYRDFVDPDTKTTDEEWLKKAIHQLYYSGGAKSLLHGKDVKKIKAYAAGKHDMTKFRAMFPKRSKQPKVNPTDIDRRLAEDMGIDFEPLGVLQQPLANAIGVLQKQLLDISFTAIDPTANADREMDMERVRNRPLFEQAMSLAKNNLQMPLSPPGTQNNTPTVDIDTLELDPQKPDELNIWADLFYKLRPESAFEVTTDALMLWNDFKEKLDLEKRDQVYYGVSASRCYMSDITGLPCYDYEHPGHVYTPDSELPDFSDQPFRYVEKNYNVEQLLNVLGRESIDGDFIQPLFERYWKAKGFTHTRWDQASDAQKLAGIPVVYIEFKSFDVLRVAKFRSKSGRLYADVVPFSYKTNSKYSLAQNKWPQQTYYAYWLPSSDTVLKSGKVLGAARSAGKESISRFSIQIYRSKEKSDVEQCIPVVDDMQRAYIKLQQAVIMAKPKGQFIDMKYLRNAAETLSEDLDLSIDALLTLFGAHNVMIGDTEGMDGQNEGQFLPFRDIPGGLGSEVKEYMTIIQEGHQRLARLTGWNDAMTGQTPNADALVGMQKLLLQSGLNSLHYAQKAAKHQTVQAINAWAPMIQYICRQENRQTEARRALEAIVGARKIDLINDMDKLAAHQFGHKVEDAPTEEQQAELRQLMGELVRGGRIELSDYFLIRRVLNWKDAQGLLVIKEKKKAAELRRQAQEANEAMIQAAQIKRQENLERANVMAQGEVQEEVVKGQIANALFDKKAALEKELAQVNAQVELMKKGMQGQQQKEKIVTKHNLDRQNLLS